MSGEHRRDHRPVRPDFATRSVEPVLAALSASEPGYSVVRKLPDGAWGAWLVEREGAHAVLKCVWGTDWRWRLESAARVVDALAARGARVPRYLASGYEETLGTWCLQERLVGERVRRLTRPLLAEVLSFSDLQCGLARELDAFDWAAHVERRLYDERARWTEDLAACGDETAAVVRDIERLIEGTRRNGASAEDAVHGDLVATQLLAAGERLTGVVDWDAAGRGDRALDLALLLYNAFAQGDRLGEPPDEAVVAGLAERGVAIAGDRFGALVAYHALEALRFVAERNPRHVEWRTTLAARAIAAYRRVP